MSVAFSKTMRSVSADRSRASLVGIALVLVLLAAWATWLMRSRVSVYAVSSAARLEANGATYSIYSLHAGRVATSYLTLGSNVTQGDALMELDTNVQQLQLLEEQVQGKSVGAEAGVLQQEMEAERQTLREDDAAAEIGIGEAKARLREAEAAASYAAVDVERKTKLQAEGLDSKSSLDQAVLEIAKRRAAVDGFRLAIDRQAQERLAKASSRRSRIEALRRELNQLSGMKARLGTSAARMESEIELRRVTAPISGRIGEAASLKPGDVVSAGDKIGAIVPDGGLKVVAQFEPASAMGRVRTGQRARLRLEGFPWTQYGTLEATVASVSDEVRNGLVRVELNPAPNSRLALRHGLPGSAEVEVERLSPAHLVLRVAGQMLAPGPTKVSAAPAGTYRSLPQ